MIIRQLSVKSFRGINNLDWTLPDQPIICFVGPGDSTKSTILDAIEWVLSPRWNLSIFDSDFYNMNIEEPIVIMATIGGLPESYLSLDKFGSYVRGWVKGKLIDEPVEDCEEVITIQLLIDQTLEPVWTLFTERDEKKRITSARERESIGMQRLGFYTERHLSWGYGSALSRLTDDLENIPRVLAEVNRNARNSLDQSKLNKLQEVAEKAQKLGIEYGINQKDEYYPAIDPTNINENVSSITLFEGNIPTKQSGLGSKRLLALALQQNCVKEGSIQLIDEIEYGLEPHRIRHLLHTLSNNHSKDKNDGQLFITTHSKEVIEELHAYEINIVRSVNGTTTIKQVDNGFQGTIRAESAALLGKKIIVCEGKTELGICRIMDKRWAEEPNGKPFAHLGVVAVDGNGSTAPKYALHLQELGYEVCYFADGDRNDYTPSNSTLEKNGVKVICWDNNYCTEQRIFHDIPWSGVQLAINLAISRKGKESVHAIISSNIEFGGPISLENINDWLVQEVSEEQIRIGLGVAAKEGRWFKQIESGEQLGNLVYECLLNMQATNTDKNLRELKVWAYA